MTACLQLQQNACCIERRSRGILHNKLETRGREGRASEGREGANSLWEISSCGFEGEANALMGAGLRL